MTSPARLPLTLPLLRGLRWRGKLRVLERRADGRYLIAFDAIDPKAPRSERVVYDHAALTADQLCAWTGWRE